MHTRALLPQYRAYLLRCWQEQGVVETTASTWRFSVEDPHTGTRRGFATWEALLAFLRHKLEDECAGAPGIRAARTWDEVAMIKVLV